MLYAPKKERWFIDEVTVKIYIVFDVVSAAMVVGSLVYPTRRTERNRKLEGGGGIFCNLIGFWLFKRLTSMSKNQQKAEKKKEDFLYKKISCWYHLKQKNFNS